MVPSPNFLELIKQFEGFSPRVYRCPAGILTIGYGHVLQPKSTIGNITECNINQAQAEQLLQADAALAGAAVQRLIQVRLSQNQFDALVSFVFNLGAGRLQMSRLRAVINRGEHADAPAEFRRWVYGGGRKLPGLVARRAAEAELYSKCVG